MTVRKASTSNEKLHQSCLSLVKRERIAAARFDKAEAEHLRRRAAGIAEPKSAMATFRRAKVRWESFWDEVADCEDRILAAPIFSARDVRAKLAIMCQRAEVFAPQDMIRVFADQFKACKTLSAN
jgi:hypothetical protein